MKFPRRQFLHLAAGAGALLVSLRVVRADTYPSRSVRFVVGFPAGNASDVLARLMGQGLSNRLAQKLVVENRPGAGSNVGTEVVARAPPDGYTLLLITPSNALNKTLYEKLNFDFINDIAPIASICRNTTLADPEFRARLTDLAAVPMPMTPAEFEKFIGAETEKWAKVIRAAGIKAE